MEMIVHNIFRFNHDGIFIYTGFTPVLLHGWFMIKILQDGTGGLEINDIFKSTKIMMMVVMFYSTAKIGNNCCNGFFILWI